MAAGLVLTVAGTAGALVAEATPSPGAGITTTQIIYGGIVTIIVAAIGGGVQLWVNRRRSSTGDGELNDSARLAVLETNMADLKHTVEEIEQHMRPWKNR